MENSRCIVCNVLMTCPGTMCGTCIRAVAKGVAMERKRWVTEVEKLRVEAHCKREEPNCNIDLIVEEQRAYDRVLSRVVGVICESPKEESTDEATHPR